MAKATIVIEDNIIRGGCQIAFVTEPPMELMTGYDCMQSEAIKILHAFLEFLNNKVKVTVAGELNESPDKV